MKSVAIIGIGCRLPGASSPISFWRILRRGVDVISEVPPDRWDHREFYDEDPQAPGKMRGRWGGFLDQVDEFDPYFFTISPREAAYMDPQQRLLLEVAWEALEDGGQVVDHLAGGPVGVFMGISSFDYGSLQLADLASITDGYVNTGSALSVAANRLSYLFDFKGPSLAVDTACSSSLVAVHLACCSITSGESDLALAGGVNLILSPAVNIGFDKLNAMAADGRCKSFDARADGYVRSEGAGVVVLKPLDRALADGDPIYAVIRGSAINQDGRTNGLTAPNGPSQEALVREALRDAELEPSRVSYVEAHGTGTPLGDPIELNALGEVLAPGRPPGDSCAVGSVKSNCGHLEAAAGVAGLIKVALSLRHREIPPSLHFNEPNPHILFDELPLRVQDRLTPWPENDSGPLIAGVSSFGFGGTNAHVIVEEAPASQVEPEGDRQDSGVVARLVPFSAATPEGLRAVAGVYLDLLQAGSSSAAQREPPAFADLCHTLSLRRTHHPHRLGLVAADVEELVDELRGFLAGEGLESLEEARGSKGLRRKIAFVFPGQGSQWVGMGQALLDREPVFRRAVEKFDQAMGEFVDWSVIDELNADERSSRLERVDVVQPTICAVQIGLAALWRSWGIEPDAVVGQSLGEVAASHVAGALSLQDAARVICLRSQLVKRVTGEGAMAVVELSLEEAEELVAGNEDRVSVAVSNSPASTVLSGDKAAVETILAELEQKEVFCRLINVDYASHGPQMDPVCEELLPVLEAMAPEPPSLPFYSTVASVAGRLPGSLGLDARYWARNLREPSLFWSAVQQLHDEGHQIFLEISPHPVLLPAIQQGLAHTSREGTLLGSLRRGQEERAAMLRTLGSLYTRGLRPDWKVLVPEDGRCVRLPGYPWQRERFWREDSRSRPGVSWRSTASGDAGVHPLLDRHVRSAASPGVHYWELDLSADRFPYLADHRVQGAALVPAAFFVELVRAAAEQSLDEELSALEAIEFKKGLFVPEEGTRRVQLVLRPAMPGTISFELFGPEESGAAATLHVTGRVVVSGSEVGAVDSIPLREIRDSCSEELSGEQHYERALAWGLEYGPSFQTVRQVSRRDGEALARLVLPPALASEAESHGLHPALLDGCLQALAAALSSTGETGGGEDAYLPVAVGRFRLLQRPEAETEVWAHARLCRGASAAAGSIEGDVVLRDASGSPIALAEAVRVERVRDEKAVDGPGDLSSWLYQVEWEQKPLPTMSGEVTTEESSGTPRWVVFADREGIGEELASSLRRRGDACAIVFPGSVFRQGGEDEWEIDPASPERYQRLLDSIAPGEEPLGLVHAWSLEPEGEMVTLEGLESAHWLGWQSVLHLLQALQRGNRAGSARLWLVTAGVQPIGRGASISIAQAPLWGLGRTIALEHPELDCTLIDLSPGRPSAEADKLLREISSGEQEPEVALREEERYVARLARRPQTTSSEDAREKRRRTPRETLPVRLGISSPGVLDRLELEALVPALPGPGEVAVQVAAAGLNFRDVLLALGMLPPQEDDSVALGFECAGSVSVLGEGVQGLEVGDEVIAVGRHSFSSSVVTYASCVIPKPRRLGNEEAATLPVAFLTAYYALHHLGRLARGERVLIHTASGGVGLASIQLARSIGAEIYATAGSAEKRELVSSMGVSFVSDSRSLAFAEEVMDWTNGEGVDVVLNTLTGEAIERGLALLRSGGRFLELGKRDELDSSPIPLRLLENNVSFSAIDLDRLFREQPAHFGRMLQETVELFEEEGLEPLPHSVFPVTEAVSAFHTMAQARHVGKIVLEIPVRAPVTSLPLTLEGGSYLITGGLGGLGLAVAGALIERGASDLVLISRGDPAEAILERVEAMRSSGAEVTIARADVADRDQLAEVMAQIDRQGKPLKGVIHAAGVLDDGVLIQLDAGRFRGVMAPKVQGAWNLHSLTAERGLDFFVLFSSAASLLGSPGQGNYAAANAFLDSLAHYRQAIGLPALSINWGPWSEVGLAARADRGGRLGLQGIGSISPEQGLAILGEILESDGPQIGVLPVQPGGWRQIQDWAAGTRLLAALVEEEGSAPAPPTGGALAGILAAVADERPELLESYLIKQVARVLRIPPAKLDAQLPLNRLGIDSLMAVELRNRIESDLHIGLPLIQFIKGPSIAEITAVLHRELAPEESGGDEAPAEAEGERARDSLLLSLLEMSDEGSDA